MCIYSPMPHTLSYCALIGKCALIRSNTVIRALKEVYELQPKVNGYTFEGSIYRDFPNFLNQGPGVA